MIGLSLSSTVERLKKEINNLTIKISLLEIDRDFERDINYIDSRNLVDLKKGLKEAKVKSKEDSVKEYTIEYSTVNGEYMTKRVEADNCVDLKIGNMISFVKNGRIVFAVSKSCFISYSAEDLKHEL